MAEAPAFYARRGGRAADWWTLLHPPYTAWHLAYVVLGAAIAPEVDGVALGLALLAFFLAVGVAAHALDELHGRPLGTAISDTTLRTVAGLALAGAGALGVYGVFFHAGFNLALLVAIPLGMVLVVGYDLELAGLHTDAVFAWGWGGFPVAVGYVAQSPGLHPLSLLGCAGAVLAAVGLSAAQRALSTAARGLRRRTAEVTGTLTLLDGSVQPLDRAVLLAPHERALRALSWAVPVLAVAVLASRL